MVAIDGSALVQSARKRLELIYIQLGIVHAGIITATAALRHRSAEQDVEVACALEHGVGDRLGMQIEGIEGLIRSLNSGRAVKEYD